MGIFLSPQWSTPDLSLAIAEPLLKEALPGTGCFNRIFFKFLPLLIGSGLTFFLILLPCAHGGHRAHLAIQQPANAAAVMTGKRRTLQSSPRPSKARGPPRRTDPYFTMIDSISPWVGSLGRYPAQHKQLLAAHTKSVREKVTSTRFAKPDVPIPAPAPQTGWLQELSNRVSGKTNFTSSLRISQQLRQTRSAARGSHMQFLEDITAAHTRSVREKVTSASFAKSASAPDQRLQTRKRYDSSGKKTVFGAAAACAAPRRNAKACSSLGVASSLPRASDSLPERLRSRRTPALDGLDSLAAFVGVVGGRAKINEIQREQTESQKASGTPALKKVGEVINSVSQEQWAKLLLYMLIDLGADAEFLPMLNDLPDGTCSPVEAFMLARLFGSNFISSLVDTVLEAGHVHGSEIVDCFIESNQNQVGLAGEVFPYVDSWTSAWVIEAFLLKEVAWSPAMNSSAPLLSPPRQAVSNNGQQLGFMAR
eukprot:gnl/TRDRNA2_/TRDRNA2_162105_c0_seq1.p1 gnl/TRDRNA2_/TRDRNA2_162105_c0~~gnl/TRDRNA2_/TRDRNA2_162105_c0_seq1.p1  ORF type:complete len:480 (-),score=48.11 gnl/TRDRNA2_/TRDRNA2_162105_c0_seq1:143-1582(-)